MSSNQPPDSQPPNGSLPGKNHLPPDPTDGLGALPPEIQAQLSSLLTSQLSLHSNILRKEIEQEARAAIQVYEAELRASQEATAAKLKEELTKEAQSYVLEKEKSHIANQERLQHELQAAKEAEAAALKAEYRAEAESYIRQKELVHLATQKKLRDEVDALRKVQTAAQVQPPPSVSPAHPTAMATQTPNQPKPVRHPAHPVSEPSNANVKLKSPQVQRTSSMKQPSLATPNRRTSTPTMGPSPQTPSGRMRKKQASQMLKDDVPAEFFPVRDALYMHIKLLWGLIESQAIPEPPSRAMLAEFNARFNNNADLVQMARDITNAAPLIAQSDVQVARAGRAGLIKIGNQLANIEDDFIFYIHGYLAKYGIRKWSPNLEEAPYSLYNTACRITAIATFRHLASSFAYNFISMDLSFINKQPMLMQAYDHYVHYSMVQKIKTEKNNPGALAMSAAKRPIQKGRERLARKRHKYAVANDFPARYCDILKDPRSHSDDEYDHKAKAYVVKTLDYRSRAANIFFRRLSHEMEQSLLRGGSRPKGRNRVYPPIPVMSEFRTPPKYLPIDFYKAKWYNSLQPAEKTQLADTNRCAFLHDPKLSIQANKVANERLSDTAFSKKFLKDCIKKYQIEPDFELVEAEESAGEVEYIGSEETDHSEDDLDYEDLEGDEESDLEEGEIREDGVGDMDGMSGASDNELDERNVAAAFEDF